MVARAVYGLQYLCVVAALTLVVCVADGLARVAHDAGPKKQRKKLLVSLGERQVEPVQNIRKWPLRKCDAAPAVAAT